jgi:hypothetical protein
MPPLPAELADLLGDSLGVAAVLLVIGGILLRWQQDRQRFVLMQTALEKGITQFPNSPPFWLISLRQGLTMLALGAALVLVGAGVFVVGRQVPTPTLAISARDGGPLDNGPRDNGPPDQGPPPRQRPPRPEDRGAPGRFEPGPGRMPPRDRGPEGDAERRPPPPNPELERWHHAQIEQISGLVATGVGVILVVVGLMRVTFARTEKLYSTDPTRLDGM